MTVQQPDLFGELDAEADNAAARVQARDAAERLWSQPATCPCCGTTEPNGYLLRNNHGAEPGKDGIFGFPAGEHPNYGPYCLAQSLVAGHIWIDAQGNRPTLADSMTRGRELNLDVEAIAAQGRDAA